MLDPDQGFSTYHFFKGIENDSSAFIYLPYTLKIFIQLASMENKAEPSLVSEVSTFSSILFRSRNTIQWYQELTESKR